MHEDIMVELFQLQAEFCKCLADPKRLMILHELRDGEKSVGELAESLGLKQSNTSQHLAIMRKAGVIVPRREANSILYSLANPLIGQACDLVQEFIATQLRARNTMASIMRSTGVREGARANEATTDGKVVNPRSDHRGRRGGGDEDGRRLPGRDLQYRYPRADAC